MAGLRSPRQRGEDLAGAGGHRGRGQRPPRAVPAEDRPGPRVDQPLHDRGDRRQQRERHVLRNGAEQLPDRREHEDHPPRWNGPGHRRPGVAPLLPGVPRGDGPGDRGDPGRDRRRRRSPAADPAQVPHQEHHGVQHQRLRGLHGPRRHPSPPDDRFRRDPGVHRGSHVPDRGGAGVQGIRPDPVPGHLERVQGDDQAQDRPGVRRRADGPRFPAVRRGPERDAALPERPGGFRDGAPGGDAVQRCGVAGEAGGGAPWTPFRCPDRLSCRLHGPEGGVREALGRPEGAFSRRRGGTADRNHGGHRGRGVPHRDARGRDRGARGADEEARIR